MLLPEIWYAFITQPCPITTIQEFLVGIGLDLEKAIHTY